MLGGLTGDRDLARLVSSARILNVRIRSDVLTSWQRCVVAGLRPDRFEASYRPDLGGWYPATGVPNTCPRVIPQRLQQDRSLRQSAP
jgi:hypothetical protein